MARMLEFYFDVGSPYSYLAHTQLPALAVRTGAQLVYRPMLLGGVFQATGNASPAAVLAKARHMLADLDRWAGRYGVPLRLPPGFPVNTLRLMRGALLAEAEGRVEDYADAAFAALFREGRDVGDEAGLRAVAAAAGLDPDRAVARTAEPDVKEALKAATAAAVERGVFGAPTFLVGDALFFGNDRLDFVEEALRARVRPPPAL